MIAFFVTLARFFQAIAHAWADPLFRSTLALTAVLLVAFVTRLAQALAREDGTTRAK